MNTVVESTLIRLEQYFARERFNEMLKFDCSHTSSLGHLAYLSSGDGENLFTIGFNNWLLLERFLFLLGEKCPHFGDCLFLTSNSRDKDLLQKYWITKRRIETSDDEGLPELN